jgi:putative ABC transport system permease protein
MNLFHYVKRELIGRPWRTFLNALGVAIGAAMVILLFGVAMSYQKAVMAPFANADTDLVLNKSNQGNSNYSPAQGVILPAANQAIDRQEINRLIKLAEVKKSIAVLQIWSFDPGQFKVIMGIDPKAPSIGPMKAREWIKTGRFLKPGDSKAAVLESHFARFYKLKVGNEIAIHKQKFKVVGIYEVKEGAQLTATNVYLPLADAQVLAGVNQTTVNVIYLQLKDAGNWRQAIAVIHHSFPGLAVTSVDSALIMSDSLLAMLQRLIWPAAGLIIMVGLLFVYRSLIASTMERIGEFGIMKAVGWRHKDIFHTLLAELFAQVFIGAILGLVLGATGTYLTSLWQIKITQVSEAPPLPGMSAAVNVIQLPALFSASLYLSVFGGVLVTGLLVALAVAKRVASLKPADIWRVL